MPTAPRLKPLVLRYDEISSRDLASVGGKNSSLGEMIAALKPQGIRVPDGFATTADAYWRYVRENGFEERIKTAIDRLKSGSMALRNVGKTLRRMILNGTFPEDVEQAIRKAYRELSKRCGVRALDVAVRSSATAEDLPEASFAGQLETFLNIKGEVELLAACRKCYASLFTDRAIAYREKRGFDQLKIALSVGVQQMVRSDRAGAGVMFSLETESGFPGVVRINAAWGLGELVVQGAVNPDEYLVFKPLLDRRGARPVLEKVLGRKERRMIYAKNGTRAVSTPKKLCGRFVLDDDEILQLARWACAIEEHYGKPMDMEWARDGRSGQLFIVQARPETVHSQRTAGVMKSFRLREKGERLISGLSIGEAIATGKVCRLRRPSETGKFEPGCILVTEMTDPDWGPLLQKAAGIITDLGGRTCHAAIVARELGVPAIVGTERATQIFKTGDEVTLSCAEGDTGYVYDGILEFDEKTARIEKLPKTQTLLFINVASPDAAFRWWRLPCDGIGLARIEFIVANVIQVHPMALVHFDELEDRGAREEIERLTGRYRDKREYFIEHLASGIAKIAASQHPRPVVVRLSDFKANEYAALVGGAQFELREQNPMLGLRGASRYYHERYRDGFRLECEAIRRVRTEMGLENVIVMVPFCRTLEEADKVLRALARNGLRRGRDGLEIYLMCEIPANVVLAEQFATRFDGFSIGSNDLTQLMLGVDRDSAELASLFDERNEAVKTVVAQVIRAAHKAGRKVGICGQAPSDHPEFAAFLVEQGIDSISVNPDRFIETKKLVAKVERRR